MTIRNLAVTIVGALALVSISIEASARDYGRDVSAFSKTLGASERKVFGAYIAANVLHSSRMDAFWRRVESVRKKRRKRRISGMPLRAVDYVNAFPPKYKGPGLSASLRKRWSAYRARLNAKKPPKKSKGLPTIKDFLAYARKYYNFRPEQVSEREFKKRYAREAVKLGLTKAQVVGVYAFETSGLGTADMVAGMGKVAHRGRPISTAIGYAQLLVANTIEQLAKNGQKFIGRLSAMAKQPGISEERRQRLRSKVAALRKMVRYVKSYPEKWSTMLKMSRTREGRGVHAINVDADIGPWLQSNKLKGVFNTAKRKGRPNIASHQLELMNLAGPSTGLEMMSAVGLGMPTVNFFKRNQYNVNSVVQGKTCRELLKEIRRRMDVNSKNSGAIEFNAAFDEVAASSRAGR